MPPVAHIHLDPLGGIAGDMFLAAVLDSWPELTNGTMAAMHAAGLPQEWTLDVQRHGDHTLTGTRFISRPSGGPPPLTGKFSELAQMLRAAPLASAVRDRALAIFTLLAEAEAEIHGVAVQDVSFHEIADWDSVADIVGAAHLIDTLGAVSWSVGSLPMGGGRVTTAHGPLPVPAPATAKLLAGFVMVDDGIDGERVTPTGAAILRHLEATATRPVKPMKLTHSGYGFGARTLPGMSNVLRLLAFSDAEPQRITERIAVIGFEVDDQTAEELAAGLDEIRSRDGVLDATQLPAFGKKGRMMAHVQVLCRLDALDNVIDACFAETTTIGLRWNITTRQTLRREIVPIASGDGKVDVKIITRPGGRTAKAELEHVRHGGGGQAGREQRRQQAETQALEKKSGSDSRQNR